MEWQDNVVFLTGASSGIGKSLAVALAAKGAKLGLVARRADMLENTKFACEAAGGESLDFVCDITDPSEVDDAADRLRKVYGRIDILIANAGIGGSDEETRGLMPNAVRRVVETNLLGAVNSVHAVLPDMLKLGRGHLVAISSLAGVRGLPQSAAYSASKAGMTAFFESVRLDVQHKGVAVTIIEPGFIRTPLTSSRASKMPFLMELQDVIPLFIRAIEKRKRFAAFPWPLATLVRAGRFMPAWMYDRVAGRARFRE